ncbi:MAG: energy-coupling factor transporter transmembrane protein EcfT [Alphaproteobacteria bacterium]|nr:energy-coupling factor transporter transmembrane protein EcfT [Alphaproteobacteria bacterium]
MRDSEWRPLHPVNPLTKLAAAIVLVIAVTVVFDIRFQAAVLALIVVVLMVLEGVPPLRLALVMLPFALMGFGFLWTNLLFHEAGGYVESLGRFSLLRGSALDDGIVVFLRAVNFGAVSYAFVRATPPADLARALMQNAGLRPTVAFAVFSVVQFIPQLQDDLRQLHLAHALRAATAQASGIRSLVGLPRRYVDLVIPLLAGAVRRAQRSAISMEARGLTHPMRRSFLVCSKFGRADLVFALASSASLMLMIGLAVV